MPYGLEAEAVKIKLYWVASKVPAFLFAVHYFRLFRMGFEAITFKTAFRSASVLTAS